MPFTLPRVPGRYLGTCNYHLVLCSSLPMKTSLFCVVAVTLRLCIVLASNFEPALDLIVSHHGRDAKALSNTLDTLSHIATKLRDEPDNPKYRSIRLLNRAFWERVGGVNGGISFMSALGFDLVDQGEGKGPSFQTRPGAPADGELGEALKLLASRRSAERPGDLAAREQAEHQEATTVSPDGQSSFDPFATAFSRKSRTHLQVRAEQGLANLVERRARLQLRFPRIEDRNITILLPQTHSREKVPGVSGNDPTETEESTGTEQSELELVAQLWRERMARDDVERFETSAAKTLRLLRASKTYPYVLLRVRLPGGVYVQGRFNSEESMEVLETSLATEAGTESPDRQLSRSFELFVAPPTRVLARDSTSLEDSNLLAPACVLHLRWENENAEAESWAQLLEDSMKRVEDEDRTAHPRVPFSPRYDMPEASSSKRAQDARVEGTVAGGDHRDEVADADSSTEAAEPPSQ